MFIIYALIDLIEGGQGRKLSVINHFCTVVDVAYLNEQEVLRPSKTLHNFNITSNNVSLEKQHN